MLSETKHLGLSATYEYEILRLRLRMTVVIKPDVRKDERGKLHIWNGENNLNESSVQEPDRAY